jgi:hypothetical protein
LGLTFEVGDELAGDVVVGECQNDDLEAMDRIDLEVNFFSGHLFLEEFEGVDFFGHYYGKCKRV